MKAARIIAIVGAALIILSFFLPWQSASYMGYKADYSGYGMAAGSPAGNYSPNPAGQPSDSDYLEGLWGSLGFGDESGAMAMINDALNQLMAQPILFAFPAAAVLVILFSLLGTKKPHISYGLILIAIAILLSILLGVKVKQMSALMNIGKMGGEIMGWLGMGELMPEASYEFGIYGTAIGLFLVLVAGIIGWRAASQTSPTSAYAPAAAFPQASQTAQPSAWKPSTPVTQNRTQPNQSFSQPSYPPQQTYQAPPSQPSFGAPQMQQPYQNQPQQQGGFPGGSYGGYQAPTPPPDYSQAYDPNYGNQPYPPSQPPTPPPDYGRQPNPFGAPLSDNPVSGWRTIKKPGDQQQG